MNLILKQLSAQSQSQWLTSFSAIENYNLTQKTEQSYQNFLQFKTDKAPFNLFLVTSNPLEFIPAFLGGIASGASVFLCNPHWQEQEWQQVFNLAETDLIIGHISAQSLSKRQYLKPFNFNSKFNQPLILIPTGGTSGKIKFATHTWETLTASVVGFRQYFQQNHINSYCLLPLYHVSGLMQLMRSFLSDGKIYFQDYSTLKQGQFPNLDLSNYFISLVPTQLQYLLNHSPQWLQQFPNILLGGAKPWQSLLTQARRYQLNLALTYGMTETASQIVTLKPEDFLKGNQSNGNVLPHAQVSIHHQQQVEINPNQIGIIKIHSQSLCLGYYPHFWESNQPLMTDDVGYFDSQEYLHLIGRNSQTIITGGENVYPAEVESAILATNLVRDLCVFGLPNAQWGEVVTAIYVPQLSHLETTQIQEEIASKIANFKIPKYWFQVLEIPRNQQGKINYQNLKATYSKVLKIL